MANRIPNSKGSRAAGGSKNSKANANEAMNDDEIIKARKRVVAMKRADRVLFVISWGLWVLAAVWFFVFVPALSAIEAGHEFTVEPVVVLLTVGNLCGNLASFSGEWPTWRRTWQFLWMPALVAIAVCFMFGTVDGDGSSRHHEPRTSSCAWAVAAGSFAAACAIMVTLPSSGNAGETKKATIPVAARILLIMDGVLAAIGGYKAFASRSLGQVQLDVCAEIALAGIPLMICGVGCVLCNSDYEALCYIPAAAWFWFLSSLRYLLLSGQEAMSLPYLMMAIIHVALYVPSSLGSGDSLNIFNVSIQKRIRNFSAMMSQPSAGFGDD